MVSTDLLHHLPSSLVIFPSLTDLNPAYSSSWKKKDQILLSWLHTTIRPTVFAQVIGYKTARSTWEALDRAYTSQTNARYYQIKHYLFHIRKGSYSITEYMDRIRRLTDELSLIQQPMSDREIIGCVLAVLLDKLDLDYDVVVNTVHTMSTTPSFEERKSMLLNREKRLEVYHHTSQDRSTTALLASNNRDANRGYNNRGTNRGRNTNRTTFHRKKNSHGTSHDRSTLICQMIYDHPDSKVKANGVPNQ